MPTVIFTSKLCFMQCFNPAAAKSLQSCPTLCDPIDGNPPGYPVPGILQARTLEWVAISFSSARKWKVKVKSLSRVRLFATPRTAAYQAPPPMEFSRQEYWSGVPSPSPFQCVRSFKSFLTGSLFHGLCVGRTWRGQWGAEEWTRQQRATFLLCLLQKLAV